MATAPLLEQWAQWKVEQGHDGYIKYIAASPTTGGLSQLKLLTSICDSEGNGTILNKRLEEEIQAESSTALLYLDLAMTIPAMFTTLTVCSYGDINGRKLGMVLPSIGGALRGCIFLLTIYLNLSGIWFLVAAFIDGMSGSALTMFGSSCAYIADTSCVEKRALRFVILQTLYIFAIAAAQLGTGYVIDLFGYKLAFWIVAFLHTINTLNIIVFVPDSKPPQDQKEYVDLSQMTKIQSCWYKIKNAAVLVCQSAFASFTVLLEKSPVAYGRVKLMLLLIAFIFNALVLMGTSAVKTLFMLATPFCWDSVLIGYYNAITSVFHGVVGLLIVWALTKVLKESTVAIIGSISSTLGQLLFALSQNALLLYLSIVVLFGYNVVSPLVQALMSKIVHPNRQGALFATMFSIETGCDVISGALMNVLYSATVHIYGGVVFYICTGFYAISTVFLIVYYVFERKPGISMHSSNNPFPILEQIVESTEVSKIEILDSAIESD